MSWTAVPLSAAFLSTSGGIREKSEYGEITSVTLGKIIALSSFRLNPQNLRYDFYHFSSIVSLQKTVVSIRVICLAPNEISVAMPISQK
jgi:hypothetical protein